MRSPRTPSIPRAAVVVVAGILGRGTRPRRVPCAVTLGLPVGRHWNFNFISKDKRLWVKNAYEMLRDISLSRTLAEPLSLLLSPIGKVATEVEKCTRLALVRAGDRGRLKMVYPLMASMHRLGTDVSLSLSRSHFTSVAIKLCTVV